MPDDQMTLEEMQKRLKELGINPGGWTKTQGGTMTSPLLEKQREALVRVRGVLEKQAESDKSLLAELHEKVQRLEHGGGQ